MKAKSDLIVKSVAGETLLIPVGNCTDIPHGIISLSESGLFLWNQLNQERTVQDLTVALQEEYEVDSETAIQDVRRFIHELKKLNLISE